MNPVAIIIAVVVVVASTSVADAAIGINWGRQNAQKLLPSNVVDLLLQNGIRRARLFTSEEDMLRAFSGSGIELTVSLYNPKGIDTYDKANAWVESRKQYFVSSNIRQVFLADYIFGSYKFGHSKDNINTAIQAVGSLQKVLYDGGHGDQIKVTIPHHPSILKYNLSNLRPSEAEFRDDIKPEMIALLRLLQQSNAPFVANIDPLVYAQIFGFNVSFALGTEVNPRYFIADINNATYTNAFEAVFDSYIWALIKLNASDLRVIVQVGWPTDGTIGANATMAELFYKKFLPWAMSNKGTPMRPGKPIDIYIHSLTDENKMLYMKGATYTRHFGIYRSNGKPKYKIDLSGQGRDIYPSEATGIMRMPQRWCLYNGNRTDLFKVKEQLNFACSKADCTTLAPGASCSGLDFAQNVSYAFNMYFQFQFQNESECNFDGLGYVSVENPSTPECVFPVEVVKSQQPPYYSGVEKSCRGIIVILLSMLGTLFWIS